MKKLRFVAFLAVMFMVYTQGIWERVLSSLSYVIIVIEIVIWVYLILSVQKYTKPAPGKLLMIIFIITSFTVGIANGSGIYAWLKYIRYFVYFYLIYWSLWNTRLDASQWRLLLKYIIFLIILQGVGAAYNIFILNQRVEGHVGIMSSIGGTTATIFPLFIMSVAIVAFFFARKQNISFYIILLLILIASVLVGYQSGKRAIFLVIPIFLFVSFLLSFYYLRKKSFFYKKALWFFGFILAVTPIYIFGITSSKGFNYFLSGFESNFEVLKVAINYTKDYESATSQYGETIGRQGTTGIIIENSRQNIQTFLLGYGFGMVKDEGVRFSIGIHYGIVGFTRDIVSGGWLVMILTFLVLRKVILTTHSFSFGGTKIMRLIIYLVLIFTHFGYSSDFVVSLKINLLLAILLIFINSYRNKGFASNTIIQHFITE